MSTFPRIARVPHTAKVPEACPYCGSHNLVINARLETAAETPMFSSSFRGRHCLVLADGYCEWRQIGKGKQPYCITLKTGEPFAIYARGPTEFDTAEKNPVNFAILTTKANEAVSYIHDRMPVILPLGHEKKWLPPNPTGEYFFPPFPAVQPQAIAALELPIQ